MPTKPTTHTKLFNNLVGELSTADALARSTSSDASQARSSRNGLAVGVIGAAFAGAIPRNTVRESLLDGGVLKGTVSKIITILTALEEEVIISSEIKSLNGAYTLQKERRAAAGATISASLRSGSTPPEEASAPTPAAVNATTPDEAVAIILDAIKSAGTPDAVFKAAGEWITRVTNDISALTRGVEDDEEGE